MLKIAKLIFKLHRKLFGFPCRSEVRLALESSSCFLNSSFSLGVLYICGESISSISDWNNYSVKFIKSELNKLVETIDYENR